MRQKGFVLLPIVIITILISALGYFIYHNIQLKKGNGNLISPTTVPTDNLPKLFLTPNPTANWETYSFGNISFKYPDSFKYNERLGIEGCFTLSPNNLDGTGSLSRMSIKPPNGAYGGCVLTGSVDGAEIENSEKQVILNDKTYTFSVTKFILPNKTTHYSRVSDVPSKGYIIEYGGVYTKSQEQEYLSQEKTILQILSTFKFTK